MGFSFDGSNKLISLTSGTTVLDVRDMYSRWKEWVRTTGACFVPAFSVVGGEPIDQFAGVYVTAYFFLSNGWRVRSQEANHRLAVRNGVLLTIEGEDPFLPTVGSFNVLVLYSQPIRTETVATGGGGTIDTAAIARATWETQLSTITASGSFGWFIQKKLLTVAKFIGLK